MMSKFEDLPDYNAIVDYLDKKNRVKHLLIGNGFSIAYDRDIFSYNALYDFVESLADDDLTKLFKAVNTKNFEMIMRQLGNFIELARVFDADAHFIQRMERSYDKLKHSLIESVSKLHPRHVFEISDISSTNCYLFLGEFLEKEGNVFSTNYDLLLYWVLMRNNTESHCDGFGKELLNPEEVMNGEDKIWGELYWGKSKENQNVFYVHGTLPFFDTGIEIEKEVYDTKKYLLERIVDRLNNHEYLIFVTAGDGNEKLEHIMHNKYLTYCYQKLSSIQGSLVTFGFNFGEYDHHIIEAINVAANQGLPSGEKLFSIYIGVFNEADYEHIKSIKHLFKCKVNLYRSGTVNIWK